MRFFVMNKLLGGLHDTECSDIEPINLGPAPRCPQCGDVVGLLTWLPPYRVELELYGRDYGAVLDGPCHALVVTQRFADDFQAQGLTGLSGFHPVEVVRVIRKRRGPKPGPPPRYFTVMTEYGGPALDMERSRIKGTSPMTCSWCRYVGPDAIDGLALEEGTWHGEDVFRPRGLSGTVLVTERFMRFAERHAMSHMTFVPIEKYVRDPHGLFYPHSTQTDPPGKG
jgi:hypothetical protein